MADNEKQTDKNCWRICNSKSRPGCKYFYNVETKDSIWIPCDTIPKDNLNENPAHNQNIMNKIVCPQVKDDISKDTITNLTNGCSKIYNKQIINNQIPNQNFNIPVFDTKQQFYNPFNFINTVPVNIPSIPAYNHNVWKVPQVAQIIVPVSAPIINQPQMLTPSYDNQPQTFRGQHILGKRFSGITHVSTFGVRNRQYLSRKRYYKNKNDLRDKLYINNNDESKPKKHCGNATDQNCQLTIQKYLERSEQFDLTPIKKLHTSNVNQEEWYIVVDTNVLRENFNFFNKILDSDNSCRIMVPQCVLDELCALANYQNDVNIRRIFRFISEEIANGRRWTDDCFKNTQQNLSIFDVCLKLSYDKYHVVLVTQNKDLIKLRNTTNTPILVFTVRKLKNVLNFNTYANKNKQMKIEYRVSDTNCDINIDKKTNNTETLSKDTSESYLEPDLNTRSMTPSEIQFKINNVKENSDAELQNSLDLGNYPKMASPTTVNYKKRVIKLKQNDSKSSDLKKRWNNKRKNMINRVNSNNTNNSIEQKNDVLINFVGSKSNANSVDLLCSTSDSIVSDSLTLIQTEKPNIVIDETNFSLISTNESTLDTDSLAIKKQTLYESDECNLKIMFEITNENMAERLTRRCDEWLSRFIQIMEEVLSQVLYREPSFESKEFPPPWMLKEAVECVIKKFTNCFYVVDAANNLSIVILKISDSTGKITLNMAPIQFMKMYSYAVYLVKALMVACDTCEDLQNALESLEKLFEDIKNNDIECSHDITDETLQKESMKIVNKDSLILEQLSDDVKQPGVEETLNSKNINLCDVPSFERIFNENHVKNSEESGEFFEDQEDTFFSSLNLRKSFCSSSNNIINNSVQAITPELSDNEFDKNKVFIDQYKGNFDSKDVCEQFKIMDDTINMSVLHDNTINFTCFIKYFINEIRETFAEVHNHCKNYISPEQTQSKFDEKNVSEMATKAFLYIDKLYKSLENILNREDGELDKNMKSLYIKSGMKVHFDENLNIEYEKLISMCMKQAKEYLSFLSLVISVYK